MISGLMLLRDNGLEIYMLRGAESIEVKYLDKDFKKQKGTFTGFTAQIIQHEIGIVMKKITSSWTGDFFYFIELIRER